MKYNEQTIQRYKESYQKYGYDPKGIGWTRGKEQLRFYMLLEHLDFSTHRSILDLGCGFGDILNFFSRAGIGDYEYVGVDIVNDLLECAKANHQGDNIRFVQDDFMALDTEPNAFDYVIANGVFNHSSLSMVNGYEYIRAAMEKAFDTCKIAFTFSFLSDKVDYRSEALFYTAPEKILGMAYSLSNNLVLSNAYMPFEYGITVFKDSSFLNDYGEGKGGYYELLNTGFYPQIDLLKLI